MIPIPKATDTIKTVFSFPIKGSVVIWSIGLSQRGLITSSNPNILPNINPKIVEKMPAVAIIPARGAFLK
jgi:hypothetical protein